jgi:hypothetical protein
MDTVRTEDMLKKCSLDAFLVSLVFYSVSNFLVFLLTDLYAKDVVGFIQCYLFALPFFVNRLSLYAFGISFLLRNFFSLLRIWSLKHGKSFS